ncbi:uncharacterized protein Triagg1_3759 [Trichoderma aggressivum f. europaeum]|uniref:Uncharacterized protein n=1 Tax=Trichoderma aggressivum f. europaeum TaxID=173218 RepID=A0AAE1M0Y7_9HYPO|nr:hypothetical protein Triagg1_3759 [Trichoderma aggressivum f. europaeum]
MSRTTSKNVPYLLQGAEGNLTWKDGETMENAAGAASIGFATISALNCIVKNEGNVTDRDLGLIKELVNFIQPDTMNSFRKGFREQLRQATPPGGLSNSFLPKEEEERIKEEEGTQSRPAKRSLSDEKPIIPLAMRPRFLDDLKVEESSESTSVRDLMEPTRQSTPYARTTGLGLPGIHNLAPSRVTRRSSRNHRTMYPAGSYYSQRG